MTRITVDLLKKRAEHNEKNLRTLEEITLHQFDIEKIELIGDHCKRLKILYLQSNLISKMENLHKLRELEYLNLALNNIECIEGVKTCENLNKLDLTVNFVDCDNLEISVENLKQCHNLSDLFLTGNPCTQFDGYRMFVINSLPFLKRLDGTDITKSDRIKARQNFQNILKRLRIIAEQTKIKKQTRRKNIESGKETVDITSHCPEARIQNYIDDKERKEKEETENEKNKKFTKPIDPIKEAHNKMNKLACEGPNGELPKQRNLMKLKFDINENYGENNECLRMLVESSKFIDTSQMIVDIHPLWIQIQIKSNLLLLHLPHEIIVNQSKVRRILSTGWIELIMPKSNWEINKPIYLNTIKSSNNNNNNNNNNNVKNIDYKNRNNHSLNKIKFTNESYDDEVLKPAIVESGIENCTPSIDNEDNETENKNWDFDVNDVPPLE